MAFRYLNPLRTHASVITIISLLGVAVGVMVMLVVSSVMSGFETMVKERVLGQSPHLTAVRIEPWDMPDANGQVRSPEAQWRDLEKALEGLESVETAYPLVRDFVIVDFHGNVVPVPMQGIDTEDAQAIADLEKLRVDGEMNIGMGSLESIETLDLEALDLEALDQDDEGVVAPPVESLDQGVPNGRSSEAGIISSIFAEENQLMVGDVLQVISNRNVQQLKPMLERKGAPSAYAQNAETMASLVAFLQQEWTLVEGREQILFSKLQQVRDELELIAGQNIRNGERDRIESLIALTRTEDYDADYNYYPEGSLEQVIAAFDGLRNVDLKELDELEELQFNELALPKEVRVAGIYRADRFAPGPPLLVPLHLAQELAGAGSTGTVNGVAMRLKDPYLAAEVRDKEVLDILPPGWAVQTWMQQYQQQFSLISMQKLMMTLALSFIVLVAVFSIGAVMFTVTIQKKREIGVMKALGATPAQVSSVFAFQGVIVGLLGSLLGLGLSLLILSNLKGVQDGFKSIGFDPFSEAFYAFDVLPHEINPLEMAVVCLCAFLLCTVAAWIPAAIAARADAARSLRNM